MQNHCGISASLSNSPVAVNGTSTLSVNVASSVAPGTYAVVVNGMSGSQSGSLNHSVTLNITVTGGGGTPDFTLSANLASVSVAQGSSGTSTITVNPINGFTGYVKHGSAALKNRMLRKFASRFLTFS